MREFVMVVATAVVVLVVAVFGVVSVLEDLENSTAKRIEAETRQGHQQSTDWQHEFMLWSSWLSATGQTGCLKSGGVPSWLVYAGVISAGCLGGVAGFMAGRSRGLAD